MRSQLISQVIALTAVLAFGQSNPRPADVDLTPEEVADQQHYHQPLRPQFHYTPIQGHIGDATGLIYYAGEYHLFNTFDPWSQKRMAHKQWAGLGRKPVISRTASAPADVRQALTELG